nr:hypothetical protein [Mycoplasmopsis bovis]
MVFYYAYDINGRINYAYVKKIITDLINKKLLSFVQVEKHLDSSCKDLEIKAPYLKKNYIKQLI